MPKAPPSPTPGPAATRLALAVSFLIAILEGYDIQAFGVSAPKLAAAMHLGASQVGLAASAAMVGLALGALAGGWFADRVGRRPVLTVAVLAFGACSLWTSVVQSYEMLLAARFFTGLGFGAALPNLAAIAVDISSPRRRGAMTSAMFCGVPFGGACVALAVSLIGDGLSWRTVFAVGGAIPVVVAPLVLWLLPETRPAREQVTPEPLFQTLFGARRAVASAVLWAANLLTLLILYLLLNWLSSLVVAKGHTPSDGAAAALWFNLAGVVGALALGVVVDRFGATLTLAVAYLGLVLALGGLSLSAQMQALLILSAASGFLVIGLQYGLYGLAPLIYPAAARATGAGAAMSVGRIGAILGPLVAGQLRAGGLGPDQVLLALLPVAGTAGAAALLFAHLLGRREAGPAT